MKFAAFLLIVGLMVVNGCLAAVPLDEPKKLLSAPETDVLEPELVLAEPLNPALLAQGVAGRRVVRQTYDDVSVDVVNSEWLPMKCIFYI